MALSEEQELELLERLDAGGLTEEDELNLLESLDSGIPLAQPTGAETPDRPGRPEQEISQRQSAFQEFLDDASRITEGSIAEALNTASFGFSDFVAGAGRALGEEVKSLFTDEETDPGRAFNIPRERREKFREANPVTAGVASFAGGFANPAVGPAGRAIANAPGLVSKVFRSGGIGAGFGGGQAAGEEIVKGIGDVATGQEVDLGESAERVGTSALLGGGIGTTLPPAIKGLAFLGKTGLDFLRRISPEGQETRSLLKVMEALQRDGFTADQAKNHIVKLGPEAALLDAGENSRALASGVSLIPGKAKTLLTDKVRIRQEGSRDPNTGELVGGQVKRIQDHMDQLIKANFFTERQRLANLNNASKFYKNAYDSNQQIDNPSINRLLKTHDGRKAFKEARITLSNLGKNLSKTDPELAAQLREVGGKATGKGVGKGLKLEFLDQVKQELWTLEQNALTNPGGKATPRSRSITILRQNLTKAMDDADVTGDYARARLAAGDTLGNQEALEKGMKFMSKSEFATPEDLGVALKEMTPEARHLFRVGAAQSLKGKLAETVSRADATKKLIDIQALEQKTRLAFGDAKMQRDYITLLENEKEMFRAVTEILGNSKTAARGEALKDLPLDPQTQEGIKSALSGDWKQAAINISRVAFEKASRSESERARIAELLAGRELPAIPKLSPAARGFEKGLTDEFTQPIAGAAELAVGSQGTLDERLRKSFSGENQ